MSDIINETTDSTEEVAENIATEEIATEVETDENVEKKAIEDFENPLNEQSSENLANLLRQLESMVQIMQSQWEASARELDLKDVHMRQLAAINDKYKEEMPEHLTEEQRENWDYLNGIDKITDEDIDAIFEEGHKVRGVDHSQTVDRIKGACQDFFAWVSMMKEYRNVHDAYIKLIELEEEKQIEELKILAEKEEDQEKKERMLNSVDMYYNRKYLKWLSDPVDDVTKKRVINVLEDPKKAEYSINRCRDRLKQLKISSKFILELSQFEKRFLEEKYHKCSNVLLAYFLGVSIYMDPNNKADDGRVKTVCMVMAMDAFIRDQWDAEHKQMLLDNIIAFEDQFLDIVPEPNTGKTEDPITDEVEKITPDDANAKVPFADDVPDGVNKSEE